MRKLALVLLFLLPATTLLGQETPAEPAVHEIRLTAKKYEYNPKEIRVKQGERVRLVFQALDRKHGFQIKDLGIKTELEKGKDTVVEFTPEKPGEYQFKCSVFCGFGHGKMRGTLIVEPAEEKPASQE